LRLLTSGDEIWIELLEWQEEGLCSSLCQLSCFTENANARMHANHLFVM